MYSNYFDFVITSPATCIAYFLTYIFQQFIIVMVPSWKILFGTVAGLSSSV